MQLAYCGAIAGWLLYAGNWPTPDQIGIALFVFAVLMGRGLAFLRDWSPFILLILSYEAMRGLADGLVANTHVQFAIDGDRALFGGTLPTVFLQRHLWDPNHLHWYDYLSAFMHPMHFIVPLAFAFVLWTRSKRLYWRFVASYLLLSYAGFLTYVLFPAAPPWYASNAGRIPHIDKILDLVLWRNSTSQPVVLVYKYFDANAVAAMPSLHAAFPVLLWLIVWKLRPRWGWLTIVYPLTMDFAVVYMGEHYVTDVLAGTVYGAAAFAAVWTLPGWLSGRRRTRLGPRVAGTWWAVALLPFRGRSSGPTPVDVEPEGSPSAPWRGREPPSVRGE
ncbi:MAG: phosphatase PAP2 family protein [Dehalococcoidia bacterium]|nr:phosphatase PAP2 family protein [Dehalococcoidia bacterium]